MWDNPYNKVVTLKLSVHEDIEFVTSSYIVSEVIVMKQVKISNKV